MIAHSLAPLSTSSSSPEPETIVLLDGYAFLSEKVLHGNPSGIDNAVSARGGAVAFSRALPVNGNKGEMTPLGNFGAMRMLLTNTKVPRDTKTLVAGVGQLKVDKPDFVQGVLGEIKGISERAREVLGGGAEGDRGKMIEVLEVCLCPLPFCRAFRRSWHVRYPVYTQRTAVTSVRSSIIVNFSIAGCKLTIRA